MYYVYLDESGDLGFDFEDKRPSIFFTITIVIVKGVSCNKLIKKEIETVIKRKINLKSSRRNVDEIKGCKTNLSIKKYLYKRVQKHDFDVYSITL